ncbi:MAG: MarR family transcriptional regulator [Chthonomonas sp.]|nr:MarR family transcriptional regulator [Chthonomonas sp.]
MTPYDQLSPQERAIYDVQEQFIMEWGRMSSSWGINRTMAQIHALLFITGKPFSMDDIIERLHISRGNASMNLRDLMEWGIIRRFRRPGDRKDIYLTDSEPWQMVARVVRERKRRELDPTNKVISECLDKVPSGDDVEDAQVLRQRLQGLLDIFGMVDAVYEQVFKNDETFHQTLKLFGRND